MISSPISSFYRFPSTIINPLLSLFGIFGNLSTYYHPKSLSYLPYFFVSPETILLLDSVVSFLVDLTFLQVLLLREGPPDIMVSRA